MMVDADLPAGQVKRLAQNIYHASRRIQTMLQDLLNVSRGGNIEAEPCLLKDVVDAAAAAQREAAAARGVKVEIDVPDDLELPLQRARVERVFENLIGNAIDVMPAGGAIRIRTKRAEAQVVVEVEDTGPGIPAEIREKLFQPFVTHGKRHGLGLGLALSRQTILDHGGEMWASGVPGGGARFSVRLPRTPAARAVLQ